MRVSGEIVKRRAPLVRPPAPIITIPTPRHTSNGVRVRAVGGAADVDAGSGSTTRIPTGGTRLIWTRARRSSCLGKWVLGRTRRRRRRKGSI